MSLIIFFFTYIYMKSQFHQSFKSGKKSLPTDPIYFVTSNFFLGLMDMVLAMQPRDRGFKPNMYHYHVSSYNTPFLHEAFFLLVRTGCGTTWSIQTILL